MRISFRIYRSHDYDLMVLYRSGALNVIDAAAKAIAAEANGYDRLELMPDDVGRAVISVPTRLHLVAMIDDEKSKELITRIPSGARCSWIKNLIRKYLKGNGLVAYDGDRFVVTPVAEASGSSIHGKRRTGTGSALPRKKKETDDLPERKDTEKKPTLIEAPPTKQTPAENDREDDAADIFAILGQ